MGFKTTTSSGTCMSVQIASNSVCKVEGAVSIDLFVKFYFICYRLRYSCVNLPATRPMYNKFDPPNLKANLRLTMKIGINEFLLHSFIELASCLVSRTEHSVKKG